MRIYLDYNIIICIKNEKNPNLNEVVMQKKESGHIFVFSPAHLEELAVSEKRSNSCFNVVNSDLNFMTEFFENHSIIPRVKNFVEFDGEYPRDCYKRVVCNYDSNDIAELLAESSMNDAHDRPAGDPKEINNCDPVQFFSDVKFKEKILYSLKVEKIINQDEAISCLKNDNYELIINRFCVLQYLVSYFADCLEKIGYFRESRKPFRSRSRMHDVSHIIYGAYSDIFVSNDIKLIKKASAIYSALEIKTKVVSGKDFIK